jgi:hypothetical protein
MNSLLQQLFMFRPLQRMLLGANIPLGPLGMGAGPVELLPSPLPPPPSHPSAVGLAVSSVASVSGGAEGVEGAEGNAGGVEAEGAEGAGGGAAGDAEEEQKAAAVAPPPAPTPTRAGWARSLVTKHVYVLLAQPTNNIDDASSRSAGSRSEGGGGTDICAIGGELGDWPLWCVARVDSYDEHSGQHSIFWLPAATGRKGYAEER